MESGVYLLTLTLLLYAPLCFGQWTSPFYERGEDERAWVDDPISGTQDIQNMYLLEEVEEEIVIAYFTYQGDTSPELVLFIEPNGSANDNLGLEIRRSGVRWMLVVTKTQDYESSFFTVRKRYVFAIQVGSVQVRTFLEIMNINDNAPEFFSTIPFCLIPENVAYTTNCTYRIQDIDGELQNITVTVNGYEANFFSFEFSPIDNDNQTSFEVYLKTEELDYENTTLHFVNLVVSDGDFYVDSEIVVRVDDMPDMPPTWVNIFASQEFLEKEQMSFFVLAIDGDIGLNWEIFYKIINTDWSKYISINNSSGEITVLEIDRDAEQNEIYTFTIEACEVPDEESCVRQNVTFILIDKNDNKPVLTVSQYSFTIPESTITSLEPGITANDIDAITNAQYTIRLIDNKGSISYSAAFSVVPGMGFQEVQIYLFIINSTLLDYEDPDWQSFSFTLETRETGSFSDIHFDSVIFYFNLINLNDELPIFAQDEYTATVKENVTSGTFIQTVLATDADVDDVVTHELLGGTIIRRAFLIDPLTGDITTQIDNAFDYETQREVFLQIQAMDSLLGINHRAIAQLTITVIDVNDETPRISVATTRISIPENLNDGTEIESNITAVDEDTTAFLVFSVNWTTSYATKNGVVYANFTLYRDCVFIETVRLDDEEFEDEDVRRYAKARLLIRDVVPENTPDFEEFDTMYLTLTVTDMNQEEGLDSDTVTLPIYIENINDNDPVFDESTITSSKTARENIIDVVVGTIIATDRDGDSITYSLKQNDDPRFDNLISINERGELRVIGEIDADIPLYALNYTVTASDGERSTDAQITIEVLDTNDNTPQIDPLDAIIYVPERTEHNTEILKITATDADRDEPFRTVYFEWSTLLPDLATRRFFDIDLTTGAFSVVYTNPDEQLDRDLGIPAITINIMINAVDNYYGIGGPTRLQNSTSFIIVLTDINNKAPVLITSPPLSGREDFVKDNSVGQIRATDDDEPGTDNTRINFVIAEVLRASDGAKEPPEDPPLFHILSQDHDAGTAQIITNYPLREYHGTYTLVIHMNDFGVEPQHSIGNINIEIEKYNFNPPQFVSPSTNNTIYLEKDATVNSQLVLYNGAFLPDIRASDLQGEKWQITYTIQDESNIFILSTLETSSREARLLVQRTPIENHMYEFTLIATDNGTPQQYSTSMDINAMFIDVQAHPRFDEVEQQEQTLEIEEETMDEDKVIKEFLRARYIGIGEQQNFPVYYFIGSDTANTFTIPDITVNQIGLKNKLDREDIAMHSLTITASRVSSGNSLPDDRSVLRLTIKVLDINDNPPIFQHTEYFSTIMSTYEEGRSILSVVAEDADEDPILNYSIDYDRLVISDQSLAGINQPFNVITSNNIGTVQQQFTVLSNMNGFFIFYILVTDGVFTAETQVRIFIVTETHAVEFTFQNDLETVNAKQVEIVQILEDEFQYRCNIENTRRDASSDGVQMNDQTIVRVHFINTESNEPVNRTQIEIAANDVNIYSRLRQTFLSQGLVLLSFIQETESDSNMEAILTGWLIGVSVVLGTLLIALIVAFILKTRSLKKRLDKLSVTKYGSQESGLNRKPAPTTNMYAIEGSNPVYSIEKKVEAFDNVSIGSGDSVLVGVENNPEFDYNPKQQNGNGVIHK